MSGGAENAGSEAFGGHRREAALPASKFPDAWCGWLSCLLALLLVTGGLSSTVQAQGNGARVSFSAAAYSVNEPAATTNAALSLRLSSTRNAATTVIIERTAGSATSGDDYTAGPWTATIAANATTGTLNIPIRHDTTDEPNETIALGIRVSSLPTGVVPGSQSTATLNILDNDATSVTLSGGGVIREDGGNSADVAVTLGRKLKAGESVTAPLVIGGSGITRKDYAIALKTGGSHNEGVSLNMDSPYSRWSPAVVFTGSDVSSVRVATLTVTAKEDTRDEGASETLTVNFGSGNKAVGSNLDRASGTGTTGTSVSGSASVAISDDDQPPSLVVSPAIISARNLQNGGTATVTLTPRNSTFFAAEDGGDYLSQSFVFFDDRDQLGEIPRTEVRLSQLGLSKFSLAGAAAELTISAGRLLAIREKVNGVEQHRSVEIDLSYAGPTFSADQQVTVRVDNDLLRYGDQSDDRPADLSARFTIKPLDPNAGLSIRETGSPAETVVGENGGTDSYAIALKTRPTHPVTVTITAGAGTLVDGPDAGSAGTPTETLTFNPSGSFLWSTAQTITVTGVNDDIDNAYNARTVMIDHAARSNDHNYAINRAGTLSVKVTDDDRAGVTVSQVAHTLAENGGVASYTLKLDSQPLKAVTIVVDAGHGSVVKVDGPDSATDFTNTEALTFTPSNWRSAQQISIEGQNDDAVTYLPRDAAITHSIPSPALGDGRRYLPDMAIASVGVSVPDDDKPSLTLTEKNGNTEFREGGSAIFTVTSSDPAPSGGLAVTLPTLTFSGGYSGSLSAGTITIPAKATSVDFSVDIDDDRADEPNGTFAVALNAGTQYELGATSSLEFITTDDDPTSVTLAGSSAGYLIEGGTRTLTLTLGRGLVKGETLTMPLTFAGTAVRNTDYKLTATPARGVAYNNLNSGGASLVFTGPATGTTATAATITFTATSDNVVGSTTETVGIGLGTATNTGSGGGVTAADKLPGFHIVDSVRPSEPIVTLSQPDTTTLKEGGDAVEFDLLVSPPYFQQPFSLVTLELSGKAIRGQDYRLEAVSGGSAGSSAAFLNAGVSSMRLRLVPLADDRDEPNESIVISVPDQLQVYRDAGNAAYTVSAPRSLKFTLTKAGAPPPPPPVQPKASFASATSNPGEDAGAHSVTVNINPAPTKAVTLTYTVEGTASEGSGKDFTVENKGALSLAAGATSANIPITVVDDAVNESDESIILTLTGGQGYGLGTTRVHTVTIDDNDAAATPGVTVSTASLGLNEGGSAGSYTVVLDSKPTANVTVTATSGDAAKVQVQATGGDPGASATLSFTPTTWHQTQAVTVTPQDDADADDESVTITHAVSNTGGYGGVTVDSLTATLDDDETPVVPRPAVSIAPASTSAVTEGDTATFTLTATPTPQSAITVIVDVADSGDFANSGQAGSRTVALDTNGTGTLTVTTDNDSTDEPNGTLTATVASGQGYTPSTANASASIAVNDNDEPPPATPVVSISGGGTITEGGTATFNLSATPAPQSQITVNVNVVDSGSFASSDQAGSRQVTIGTGGSDTLSVTTDNDSSDEPNGTLTATVNSGTGYAPSGTNGSASITVNDNDDALPPSTCVSDALLQRVEGYYDHNSNSPPGYGHNWFRVLVAFGARSPSEWTADNRVIAPMTAASARERQASWSGWEPIADALECIEAVNPAPDPEITLSGGNTITEGGTATFTLISNQPAPAGGLSVALPTLTFSSGYSGSMPGTSITIAAGQTTTNFDVDVDNDSVDRPDGTLSVALQTGTGYTLGATASLNLDVADNDATTMTLAGPAGTLDEGDTKTLTLTLGRGLVQGEMLTAPLTFAGTATRNADYSLQGTAASGVTYTNLNSGSASVKFTGPNAGTSATVATLTFSATADSSIESPDETADIGLGTLAPTGLSGGAAGTDRLASFNIADPATLPTVTVTAGAAVTEGTSATFTVNANPPPSASLTVNLTITESGAFVASGDRGAQTVTIGTSGAATYRVDTVGDQVNEADGSVTVTVKGGTGYTLGNPNAATVTVSDDDIAPSTCVSSTLLQQVEDYYDHNSGTPSGYGENWFRVLVAFGARSPADWTVDNRVITPMTAASARERQARWFGWGPVADALECIEGARPDPDPEISIAGGGAITEGGTATFTLTATPTPSSSITVNVNVADSGDFANGGQAGSRTVALDTNGTGTLTVTTDNDSTNEPNGTLTATVTTGQGYTPSNANASASIAVNDNDEPPPATPVVSISGGSAITEGGTATFNLSATPAPQSQITVNVNVVDSGSFASGGKAGSRQVTIGTGGSGTLSVTTDNDSTDEPDGRLTATIAGGQGYSPSSTSGSALIAVKDDDLPPPTPTVSISGGGAITEGGSAGFTLTASPAPQGSISVNVRVTQSGNFANSGQTGSRRITIGGSGTATFNVTTNDDSDDEPDGSISARVLGGTGYSVHSQNNSDSVTVNDDDVVVPEIRVTSEQSSRTTDYEGTTLKFALYADVAPGTDLEVTVNVNEPGNAFVNTADAGTRRVTISAGNRKATLSVRTIDDSVEEDSASATVTVTVQSGTGYTVASAPRNKAEATVHDNDGLPTLSIGDSSAAEGNEVYFEVTLSKPVAHQVRFTYYTESGSYNGRNYGTASSSVDYPYTSNNASIYPGGTRVDIWVRTFDDSHDEGDETFTVILRNPKGATLDDGEAIGTIKNSDPLPDAWLARFGRAVAEQALDGITARMDAVRAPVRAAGFRGMLAGRPIGQGPSATSAGCAAPGGPRPYQTAVDAGAGVAGTRGHSDQPEDGGDGLAGLDGSERADGLEGRAKPNWGGVVENSPGRTSASLGTNDASRPDIGVLGPHGFGVLCDTDDVAASPDTEGFEPDSTPEWSATGTVPGMAGALAPMGAQSLGSLSQNTIGAPGFGQRNAMGVPGTPPAHNAGGTGSSHGPPVGGGMAQGHGGPPTPHGDARGMALQQLLTGSNFTYTREADARGGVLGFWGRGAHATFNGAQEALRLDGNLTTGLLGADYALGDWLLGVAITQTVGDGTYSGPNSGAGGVRSTLTAAVPYAAWRVSGRLDLWGAAGHGGGRMTLTSGGTADRFATFPPFGQPTHRAADSGPPQGERLQTDLGWSMAALGLNGSLLGTARAGPRLAWQSDALWSRTTSDETEGMLAGGAAVTRLRFGLAGSWMLTLGDHGLTPKLEAGVRHDGGDAETGFGVEVGGGIGWLHPGLGLSLDLEGRTLLAHEADGRRDLGFSAALAFDPSPRSRRGPKLSLRQDFGGQATGGLDALFAANPLAERMGQEAAGRWTAEAAWGFPTFRGRFIGAPTLGYGVSAMGRDYSLGWQLEPLEGAGRDLSFGLKLTRRESLMAPPAHGIGAEFRMRW